MNADLQLRIQRYGWDKASPHYEIGWEEQLWPAQERLLDAADLKPGEKVLDISCGTGLVTLPAANIVTPGGSVTGIDLSEGMIEEAQQRLKNREANNVTFQQMDAEALEFEDNSFDVAICSLGLMYFPNPVKAIEEMYRVLASGGRAVTLVWGERQKCGWADIFPIIDKRVKSDVCPLFFQMGTGNLLSERFNLACFKEVESIRFTSNLHFSDDEQACIAAFLGGAVALAYSKFDENTRIEANKEYLDSIKPYFHDMGYKVPGEFVIVTGKNID